MQVLSVDLALFQGQYFTHNAILLAAANMATFALLIALLFFRGTWWKASPSAGLSESRRAHCKEIAPYCVTGADKKESQGLALGTPSCPAVTLIWKTCRRQFPVR
jgi:hypothetical protein